MTLARHASLIALILSAAWTQAWSEDDASIKDRLKKHLIGCKNDQVCCGPCGDVSSSLLTCVGDGSTPRYLGKCEDVTSSVAANLRYRHSAWDYRVDAALGKGCASCGSAPELRGEDYRLPTIELQRNFFADTDLITSLGTHWGFNWDVWIKVFPPGSIASGRPTDVPGWQVLLSQPMSQPIDFFVAVDGAGAGNFQDKKSGYFPSLRFFDAAGTLVTDPTTSVRAEQTTWDGQHFTFEMYEESPGVTLGRLVRYTDRNGNAVRSEWKYAVDDPAMTGSLRLKLRIRERLVDAHGLAFVFTYDEATLVQGTYVATRIDLPNGTAIHYRYGTIANVWYGTDEALIGIDHPDGTVSAFSATIDASISCLRMDFIDPVANEPTSRRKSVWLSASPWINPDDSADQYGQIFGRVRKIENADGELVFASAEESAPSLDPTYPGDEDRTYFYNQGRVTSIVHHNGDEMTARYQRNADGGPLFQITPDWTGWTKIQSYTPDVGLLGDKRIVDGVGNVITYERDPVSDRILSVTHPDGTTETYTYNAFQEVLRKVDRLGRITDFTYDLAGNLLSKTVAVGTPDQATWSNTYWSASDTDPERGKPGQLRTATDADGHVTDYAYDPRGFVTRIREPADIPPGPRSVRTFTWDAAGRIASSTDGAGRVTTFAYDAHNRLVQTTYLDGSTEQWLYRYSGDDAGLLVGYQNRNGNQTTYGYDRFGRKISQVVGAGSPEAGFETWTYLPGNKTLVTERVSMGDTERFVYDERLRRIARIRSPTTSRLLSSTFAYDNADRQIRETDPYGRSTYQRYDSDYRVVRTARELVAGTVEADLLASLARVPGANPPCVIEDQVFDSEGQRLSGIDGRGIATTYAYDGQGRMTFRTEAAGRPEGASVAMRYDPQGNLVGRTDPRGIVTATSYTGRNLVAQTTEAAGTPVAATTRSTYTPTRKLATQTDALGRTTSYAYGACCDRLVGVTDALGFTTTFAYDAFGSRTSATDANGNTETWAYDHRNREVAMSNGAGEVTVVTYLDGAAALPEAAGLGLGIGADGSARIVVDPERQRSIVILDGIGREVRRVDGLGHATTMGYDGVVIDGVALVATTVTDALGHTMSSEADGAERIRVQVDQIGKRSTIGSDADGNRVSERDPNGVGLDCGFDARNRLIACTDTRGAVTVWAYDADGNVTSSTDALGHVTTSRYDPRNRKTSTTDRIGATTSFTYDAVSNLRTITDAEGGVTAYAYDSRNLLISESFPGAAGGIRTYTYDGGRRLRARTDQAGVVTSYAYDPANRLTARQYADGQLDGLAYDHAGRLTGADSGRFGTHIVRGYDAASRLVQEQQTIDVAVGGLPTTYTVGFAYDAANRTTQLTYPDGRVQSRTYDARDLLSGVSLGGSPVASRTYDDGRRLATTTYGNGLVEHRTYTVADNTVASIVTGGVTDFSYTYDADRRALAESDGVVPAGSQTLLYDNQDRLTAWTQGGSAHTQSWALSPVGDWRSTTIDGAIETRTHNRVHETLTVGAAALAYDSNGNPTQDDVGHALSWDPENRLITATVSAPNGAEDTAVYRYDALGRRLAKTVYGRTTVFIHAGAQVIHEADMSADVAPAQAASDGDRANVAATPPGGGILDQADVLTRINFQPATMPIPKGFIADKGRQYGPRTNGLTYGWVGHAQPFAIRRGSHPLPQFDSFDQMQPTASAAGEWEIALPDGEYPVIAVFGDATSLEQTNTVSIENRRETDPDPYDPRVAPGYTRGDFDGYTEMVRVRDGKLTISAAHGSLHPKLCWLEIGKEGTRITPAQRREFADMITYATSQTGAPAFPPQVGSPRAYAYGSHVDEPLMSVIGATKYYLHSNRLHSVEAVTDGSRTVQERYRYDAYGKRTALTATGTSDLGATMIGNHVGFTGRYHDVETGLMYFRSRTYSPRLGRFLERDPLTVASTSTGVGTPASGEGYSDGTSLYGAYFVPNATDPTGMVAVTACTELIWIGHQGNNDSAAGTARKDTEDKLKRAKAKGGCPGRTFRIGFVCCHGDEYNNQLGKDFPDNLVPGLPPESGFGVEVPPGSSLEDANSKLPPSLREPGNFDMAKAITAAIAAAMKDSPTLCGPCCKSVTIVVHCADSHPGSANPQDVTNLCGQQITVPCDWLTSPGQDPLIEWSHGKWIPTPATP